jgi:hypothetical protein
MSALNIPTQALWVPGQGVVPTHVRQAMKAVEEYDTDLSSVATSRPASGSSS